MAVIIKGISYFFHKHPLLSNSVIYGGSYAGAETTQQIVTRKIIPKEPDDLDTKIILHYAIMGTFCHSPILYHWYKWLDGRYKGTTTKIVFKKLLVDQFVITPPLLTAFFIGMSLMDGASDPFEECRLKMWPTFFNSCFFWLPAQTVNFIFVPSKYRVIYVGACTIVWTNILCWIKRQDITSEAGHSKVLT